MYNKKKKIKHKTLKTFCLLIGMIVTGKKQNNDTKFTEKISTTKNRRKKISLL